MKIRIDFKEQIKTWYFSSWEYILKILQSKKDLDYMFPQGISQTTLPFKVYILE